MDSNDKPLQSPADFTYRVTPTTLTIKDSGKGMKSLVEDLRLCCDQCLSER